jgi:hypothetical protein
VPGADPIFATRTAAELAAALIAEGLDAEVSEDPARIAQAAPVVAGVSAGRRLAAAACRPVAPRST